MNQRPVILWLRQDLRVHDNPALVAAAETGRPVLPLFILDEAAAGCWQLGGASRYWLHQSLSSINLPLVMRAGDSESVLLDVIAETGADSVFWNRRYAPWAIAQDKAIKARLKDADIRARSHAAFTLREPWEIAQKSGASYKVYTPYSRAWLKQPAPRPPLHAPSVTGFATATGCDLDELRLLPRGVDWASKLGDAFRASEAAAEDRLTEFRDQHLAEYATGRDHPAQDGVSRLSPYLAAGLISPHRVLQAVTKAVPGNTRGPEAALPFIRQLIWRDFAYSNLYHFPDLPETSLRKEFEGYPWQDNPTALRAWQRGLTGFPIVDAGMRELWQTGYMHNRVRMIVGSFLTKDLRLHWRHGAAWFWDTLLDADLANNSMGWQWISGCGIDAAPYFRIFNPLTQADKFDAYGDYVRRFVPELAGMPAPWIHRPQDAPDEVLRAAGVQPGRTYPLPIVDHAEARREALAGLASIKSG